MDSGAAASRGGNLACTPHPTHHMKVRLILIFSSHSLRNFKIDQDLFVIEEAETFGFMSDSMLCKMTPHSGSGPSTLTWLTSPRLT